MLLAQCSVSVTTAISIKWELMRFKVLHVKKSTNQESIFFFYSDFGGYLRGDFLPSPPSALHGNTLVMTASGQLELQWNLATVPSLY